MGGTFATYCQLKNAYEITVETLRVRDYMGYIDLYMMIILKWL
jgi:hypothetical protein